MIKSNRYFLQRVTYFLFVFIILSVLASCDDKASIEQQLQSQTDKKKFQQTIPRSETSSHKQGKNTTKQQYTSISKYGWNTINTNHCPLFIST